MSHPMRRAEDHHNWIVRAGNMTRSVKFVLTVLGILLMASILFQYTAQRADVQSAAEQLDRLTVLTEQAEVQRHILQDQADLIIDCTNPKGECFQKGQQRTAEVVAGLNIVTQYSVICGEREDGEAAILECVNDEVKAYLRVAESQQKDAN